MLLAICVFFIYRFYVRKLFPSCSCDPSVYTCLQLYRRWHAHTALNGTASPLINISQRCRVLLPSLLQSGVCLWASSSLGSRSCRCAFTPRALSSHTPFLSHTHTHFRSSLTAHVAQNHLWCVQPPPDHCWGGGTGTASEWRERVRGRSRSGEGWRERKSGTW